MSKDKARNDDRITVSFTVTCTTFTLCERTKRTTNEASALRRSRVRYNGYVSARLRALLVVASSLDAGRKKANETKEKSKFTVAYR
jgi:hypothetical protein